MLPTYRLASEVRLRRVAPRVIGFWLLTRPVSTRCALRRRRFADRRTAASSDIVPGARSHQWTRNYANPTSPDRWESVHPEVTPCFAINVNQGRIAASGSLMPATPVATATWSPTISHAAKSTAIHDASAHARTSAGVGRCLEGRGLWQATGPVGESHHSQHEELGDARTSPRQIGARSSAVPYW